MSEKTLYASTVFRVEMTVFATLMMTYILKHFEYRLTINTVCLYSLFLLKINIIMLYILLFLKMTGSMLHLLGNKKEFTAVL